MLQKIEFHWSIDKKLQTITESFHVAFDRFAPYQKINFSKKSWFNKECQKQGQKKNQLFKQWIKHPSPENRDKYKKQRNVCDKTIRNAKIACYDKKNQYRKFEKFFLDTQKFLVKNQAKHIL